MYYNSAGNDSLWEQAETRTTSSEEHKPIRKYTVILLGEFGVGKSSLFRRLYKNDFVELEPITTLSKAHCTFLSRNTSNALIEVHDTAGMERLGSLTKNYYNMAHGVVIVYDITEISSIDHITKWYGEAIHYVPDATIMLLGNKKDQSDGSSCVDSAFTDNHTKASAMASNYGFAIHRTISCKTGDGISEAFEELTQVIHSKNMNKDKDRSTLVLGVMPAERKKKCSC